MFGVSPRTWAAWIANGRVTCGQRHRRASDGHTCILYPKGELRRLSEEFARLAGKPYPDPDRPGVWRVPLNGYGREREALIDAVDVPIVEGKSRCWAHRSNGKGGIVILTIAGRQRPLHRLILGLGVDAAARAARVSFANGDPLDCRRQNLVLRSQAEVAYAARPPRTREGKARTSRFKGVGYDPKCCKWLAKITRGGLNTTIGTFDDERAAAEAFDDCARVWYGEHAYLNFPERPSNEHERIRAQAVLQHAVQRQRRRERRVKRLARLLKSDTLLRTSEAIATDRPTISSDEARRLLNVPRATWRRWEKRGWIAGGREAERRGVYPVCRIKCLLEECGRLRPPYADPTSAGLWRVPLVGRGIGGRKEALIDASSLPLIEGGWCMVSGMRSETGKDAYVSLWSLVTRQYIPLRRLVAGVTDDLLQVGHGNDDALDCRRANLVVTTVAQRCYRKRKIQSVNGKPVSSQFKGVSWHKGGGKWIAMIHCGGTTRYLGLHAREEDAARAYDCAARELFGDHARFNFPDSMPRDGTAPHAAVQRDAA
jgi:hypothetical protein